MHGFKLETYRRVVGCEQGIWPSWAEFPVCLTCPVRFVWPLLDSSRIWLAKTPSPDLGSSHFLCAGNLAIKISYPGDVSSLGSEWHPHGWKCVCSTGEVNVSVTGMIQVVFLKDSFYHPCQQLHWQDGRCLGWPHSAGGVGRRVPDVRCWVTEQSLCPPV